MKPGPPNRSRRPVEDEAVLAAALECLLTVGMRRTTMADIARRAGTSRQTIYRRWPDVQSLVAEVMTRQWLGVVSGVLEGEGPLRGRAEIVDALVAVAAGLRADPLLRRIVEIDPELLVPYLFDRRGASQDVMLERIESMLAEGRRSGAVRDLPPGVMARTVLLTAQSFVLSAATMADGVTVEELDEQLRGLLDRYLTPLGPEGKPQ
ncbi:TetR/AcrR family transcriptional regulator [Actinomadura hibisca]|uniref:TetR/AcrR family transcriptional regulator n=1 Tax=Actinomadura hibisca TaxID=68565 RepID=UPI000829C105|nr:TetR/AcrR family transcriptional regulator [Actinomadura hibisca]